MREMQKAKQADKNYDASEIIEYEICIIAFPQSLRSKYFRIIMQALSKIKPVCPDSF